ncbi:hypothetical protein ACQ9LF_06185 [Anaerohalosphaeraceae bacterium U12dextr]
MSTMRSMARDMKRAQGTFKGAGRLKGHHNHCQLNRRRSEHDKLHQVGITDMLASMLSHFIFRQKKA